MATQPFVTSSGNVTPTNVDRLDTWLVNQAIHVPSGWIEACLVWLVEQHGGGPACAQLTEVDWCQLIYEQWLHADLRELVCPVLPSTENDEALAGVTRRPGVSVPMKLEGELCLQVVGLFNVGESYYGQLRLREGNLSVNLPNLEMHFDADLNGELDLTQMTQMVQSQYLNSSSYSQHSNPSRFASANGNHRSLSLYLTDGVHEIKAIEVGSLGSSFRSSSSLDDLLNRLRPGTKVRIRGPLTLRNNVLLLPAGAIETLTSQHLEVLGGEVDELLSSPDGQVIYRLGKMLASKLNIPILQDGNLPSWFPRITPTRIPAVGDSQAAAVMLRSNQQLNGSTDFLSPPPPPQSLRQGLPVTHTIQQVTPLSTGVPSVVVRLSPPSPIVTSRSNSSPAVSWNLEDDALISAAAQDWEQERIPAIQGMSDVHVPADVRDMASTLPETAVPMIHRISEPFRTTTSTMKSSEPLSPPFESNESNEVDISQEVDPDVFASALDELDQADEVNKISTNTCSYKPGSIKSLTPSAVAYRPDSTIWDRSEQSCRRISPQKGLRQTLLVLPVRSTTSNVTTTTTTWNDSTSSKLLLPGSSKQPIDTPKDPSVSDFTEVDDLLPPAAKRKPWERIVPAERAGSITNSSCNRPAVTGSSIDYQFHPFCYIEDMYHELIEKNTTTSTATGPLARRVYTIRGLLITLLSSLEHHQGSRWTLAARLADGSATVDVDFASELLTSWIGLTSAESESLRQFSRCSPTASAVAQQEAQKHRQRLRTALTNFQQRISNLSGLFDLTVPSVTASTTCISSLTETSSITEEKPVRPILIDYRPLIGNDWLKHLHDRIQSKWGSRNID